MLWLLATGSIGVQKSPVSHSIVQIIQESIDSPCHQNDSVGIVRSKPEKTEKLKDSGDEVTLTARTYPKFRITVLNWKAVHKKKISYEVFRSTDDGKSWKKIGEVKSRGDSVLDYEFNDAAPDVRNFYQLRIVTDSGISFSNRSEADFSVRQATILASFNQYPERSCFSFSVKARCEYRIQDSSQRVVMTGETEGLKEITDLQAGTYFLHLYSPGNIETFEIRLLGK